MATIRVLVEDGGADIRHPHVVCASCHMVVILREHSLLAMSQYTMTGERLQSIHFAVKYGQAHVIRFLASQGVNLNDPVRPYGEHHAVPHNHGSNWGCCILH